MNEIKQLLMEISRIKDPTLKARILNIINQPIEKKKKKKAPPEPKPSREIGVHTTEISGIKITDLVVRERFSVRTPITNIGNLKILPSYHNKHPDEYDIQKMTAPTISKSGKTTEHVQGIKRFQGSKIIVDRFGRTHLQHLQKGK